MASTFTTGFGIEKIGSGEQSGAWGTTTNHNLDILDRIASYKAVALSGTTHTLTVREASPGSGTENLQDGMYRVIKFTGALGGNNTVTIAPNTAPAYFIFENATTDSGSSGPYSVILTQGSGANITIQNGKNAIVYCDGAGSGAAVVNALSDLQIATLEVTGVSALDGAVTVGGASQFNSTVTVGVNDTGYDVQFFGATSGAHMLWDESADDLKLVGAAGLTVAGDIDVDGTTNLDAVDIDGAVQLDSTLTVGVDDTGYDVKFFGDTASAYMLWDTSADDLILGGAAGLSVAGITGLTGNVGVGPSAATTTVTNGLAINNATATNYPGLEIQTAGTTRFYLNANNAASYITAVGNTTLSLSTNSQNRLHILGDGKVGIGTTSPAQILETKELDETGFTGIRINNPTGNVGSAGIEFQVDTTYSKAAIYQLRANANGGGDIVFVNDSNFDAANWVAGDEKMRITSGGNVGIGKTPTDKPLEIYAATTPALRIQNSATGTGGSDGLLLEQNGVDSLLVNYEAGVMKFSTSNTERMRIEAGGSVLVGTTSNAVANAGKVVMAGGAAGFAGITNSISVGGGYYHLGFAANTSLVGSITGGASSVSYNTSSDYRLKNTIAPMTGALDKVALLKPVTFKWNLDGSTAQGFIAHELQAVVPDCVSGEKDAVDTEGNPQYQGVDTSFLVATLTAAIQEQQALIEALTTRITALEG